jgi:hypothetical protein
MTKPKIPDPVDPKAVVTEVFRRTGGIKGMTAWSKSHKTLFYNLYSRLISQPPVVVDARTVNVNEAERAGLAQTLTDSLARIIKGRREDEERTGMVRIDGVTYRKGADGVLTPTDEWPDGPVATITDNSIGETIEHGPLGMTRTTHKPVTIDNDAQPHKASFVTDVEPPAPPRSQPRLVTPQRSPVSTVPGLAAGAAVGDEADDGRSTTQKFLDWSGHGRH